MGEEDLMPRRGTCHQGATSAARTPRRLERRRAGIAGPSPMGGPGA